MGDESGLLSPADKPAESVSREPGPDAPLVAAAVAAHPRADRGGVEEFWSIYPRRYKRADAEAAWSKLSPTPETVASILAGARAYADHHRLARTDMQYIKRPAKWLSEKCWTEDPSAAFTPKAGTPRTERKTSKKPGAKPSNDNRPANIRGGTTTLPAGDLLVEIVGCVDGDWFRETACLELTLRDSDDREFQHLIHVCAVDEADERAGRDCYRALCDAVGGEPAVGVWLWAHVGKTVEYRAAMAPTSAQGAAIARNGAAT